MSKLISGISSRSSGAKNAFVSSVNSAVRGIVGFYRTFYNAGSYLVDGFCKGISENDYKAAAKAHAMARKAAEAAAKALDEHSPSKVFYKIGAFAGQGLVNALDFYGKIASRAGHALGTSATFGLSKSIDKVSTIVNNNIDPNPAIKPVIDLSNVKTGVDAIKNLLGIGSTIGVDGSIDAINARMNQNQNGSNNDDIIEAIGKLKKVIGDNTGDTININGVKVDGTGEVAEAVQTLVRAVKIKGRT